VAASWLLIVLLGKMSKQQFELAALSAQLSLANKALEQQSLHDGLTELANRRFFDTHLASQMGVARRHPQRMLALIMFDIDFFQSLQRPLRPRRRRRMSAEGRQRLALMLPPPR